MKKNSKVLSYVLIIISLFGSFFLGVLFKTITKSSSPYSILRSGGYEYINPLVDFEQIDSAKEKDLINLRKELKKYVDEKTQTLYDSEITDISIYYKDLNSGAWIGINEKKDFSPASLLKVPLMMAIYKIAEDDDNFLKQKYIYNEVEDNVDQNFPPKELMIDKQEYSLDEMIDRMIKYSDNAPLPYIHDSLTDSQLTKIYSDLGLENPFEGEDAIMNVKEYSSFFRILYNASYLNKKMSEKALKLLVESDYDNGIQAGIPKDIKMANKFGERINLDEVVPKKQFHDCGIVYHPTKPYILCIMAKGYKFKQLELAIKDISTTIYKNVDK